MTIPLFFDPPPPKPAHICHAHDCDKPVPPKMFMCKPHWYALRHPMRDAIWREYRRGQEVDKRPSVRYLAVQQRAVGEVAFRPHDEQAARVAASYFIKAEYWRARAVSMGVGDPLEGLVPDAPLTYVPEAEP